MVPITCISPTSLETYANCPFAYFLNRVIGIEALPEVEPNLSAGDRGTAIHTILSTLLPEMAFCRTDKNNSCHAHGCNGPDPPYCK